MEIALLEIESRRRRLLLYAQIQCERVIWRGVLTDFSAFIGDTIANLGTGVKNRIRVNLWEMPWHHVVLQCQKR